MVENKQLNRTLRILFMANDKYPPYRVDVATLFGQELVARGHRIDWVLQSRNQCDSHFQTKWAGGDVWVGATDLGATSRNRLRKHIYMFANDLKVFSLSRRRRYDVIQVRDKFIAGLMAIVTSRINRTKFVYWLSFPFPEAKTYRAKMGLSRNPWFNRLQGRILEVFLYRVIMPNAAHIFVQSEQMRKDVAEKGIPLDKLTAVPMGVSLEQIPYPPTDVESRFDNADRIVLYLGDLSKVRGIDFLLRVHKGVLEKIPEAKLYLVGGANNPDDIDQLRSESVKLGIEDSVIFTGFIEKQDAWAYVSRASVCVSPLYPTPIYRPASPTKLVEYMANAKAVVVNDHPEQRQVVEESGAGICVPYEEAGFARAVIDLLNDPDKAKEMGLKGRRYVERYRTYRVLADKVENKYFEICGVVAGSDG